MTNEEFQRLVLQELGDIKKDVSKLEKGQQAIIKDVSKLEKGQQALIIDVSTLKEDVTTLKEDVTTLKEDVTILKDGQKDIKALIEDLDPKNANRHVELVSQINGLREDLNTIEVITSKNWNDIAKLKSVK